MDIQEFLENERVNLQDKIEGARRENNIGTYKNLIVAYKEILRLQEDTKPKEIVKDIWELKYSKYKMDNSTTNPMISIWEQNSNGEVRNIEKFKLYDDELLSKVIGLINQVDINDYEDSNGHYIKKNNCYCALRKHLMLDSVGSNPTITWNMDNGTINIDSKGLTIGNGEITIK